MREKKKKKQDSETIGSRCQLSGEARIRTQLCELLYPFQPSRNDACLKRRQEGANDFGYIDSIKHQLQDSRRNLNAKAFEDVR